VEADELAKAYWPTAAAQHRHYEVPYEPWSLWYAGRKLSHPSTDIYNIIHGEVALQY